MLSKCLALGAVAVASLAASLQGVNAAYCNPAATLQDTFDYQGTARIKYCGTLEGGVSLPANTWDGENPGGDEVEQVYQFPVELDIIGSPTYTADGESEAEDCPDGESGLRSNDNGEYVQFDGCDGFTGTIEQVAYIRCHKCNDVEGTPSAANTGFSDGDNGWTQGTSGGELGFFAVGKNSRCDPNCQDSCATGSCVYAAGGAGPVEGGADTGNNNQKRITLTATIQKVACNANCESDDDCTCTLAGATCAAGKVFDGTECVDFSGSIRTEVSLSLLVGLGMMVLVFL